MAKSTVVENALQLPRAILESAEFELKAIQAIDFLEIGTYRDPVFERLPIGIQKRVVLARALVPEPEMILMDNLMAGMNKKAKKYCRRLISGARVSEIIYDDSLECVSGAVNTDQNGRKRKQMAKIVTLCTNAIGTPRIC